MSNEQECRANRAEFLLEYDGSPFPEAFLQAYDVMECLAHNEYSETYLVLDKENGLRAVAKCYAESVLPYVQEGKLLQTLHHKDLPAYLCSYENEEMLCVVREYIDGVPLNTAATEHGVTPQQALAIGLSLCGILQYLHNQNPPVIHRDIKPENIILRPDGSVALIDFGISRAFRQGAEADTMNFGTKCFSAPEQYGYAQTDCRSDLFSLGMVMGYLLTGSTKVSDFNSIGDKPLARVIATCTAFNPRDRYSSVEHCRRALCALLPQQKKKRKLLLWASALFTAAALATAGMFVYRADTPAFREPLMERAVRAALGKSETDTIRSEELLSVNMLCVFGNAVSKDTEGFYAAGNDWYASADHEYGGIASLEDVRLLPNLQVLCLAAQQISDLSPLASLTGLEKVEFKHNRISDISVLASLPKLSAVGLNDNPIGDVSPLAKCQRLRFLDLCSVRDYDPLFLASLGDFQFLDIANNTDSYAYLGSRRVQELKIGYSNLDSLTYLSGVTGLTFLEVKGSKLKSLAGIETHKELATLNIAGCAIGDLTPLLALPSLQTLVLSENMRPALEALGDVSFAVFYE